MGSELIGKKNRPLRMAIGFILPPYLGALLSTIALMFLEPFQLMDIYIGFISLAFFGFIFTAIQSALYTVLMELVINPRIKNHLLVVAASVLLGSVAIPLTGILIISGAIAGLIIGIVLRWLYVKAPAINQNNGAVKL